MTNVPHSFPFFALEELAFVFILNFTVPNLYKPFTLYSVFLVFVYFKHQSSNPIVVFLLQDTILRVLPEILTLNFT